MQFYKKMILGESAVVLLEILTVTLGSFSHANPRSFQHFFSFLFCVKSGLLRNTLLSLLKYKCFSNALFLGKGSM